MRKYNNIAGHSDSDRKNSWYWNVLVKNLGSWKKAEKAVVQSRKRIDPTYFSEKYNHNKF